MQLLSNNSNNRRRRNLALAAIAISACYSDRGTGPATSPSVSGGPALHTTATSIGTYSIPIPGTNTDNDGIQPITSSGIVVPAGTYYRVRVNGTVVVSPNPVYQAAFQDGTFPDVGSYGPGGTGSFGQLTVLLKARNTDGSGTGNISLPNLATGPGAADSARSNILYADKETDIQVGRNGLGRGTSGIGSYSFSASEIVTVEAITDVVHVTANPSVAHANQQVTFTASGDDGQTLNIDHWHWQPDAGQSGNAVDPCWNLNPCQMNVAGSGTMTIYTTIGSATAHVTIYSSFTLDADQTSVHPGDTVTFTPMYDGSAGAAARWRWAPDDTSSDTSACAGGATTCKKRIRGPGTMWAYNASSGGDSASKHVSTIPRRHLTLSPSDTAWVQSGSSVEFTVSAQGAPLVGVHWSSEDLVIANRAKPRNWNGGARRLSEANGVSMTTCADNVTACTDVAIGTYTRSVSATVDDSVQTASVAVATGTITTISDDSTDYDWGGPAWADTTSGGEVGPTYLAPYQVRRPSFHLDFTDQNKNLHHFDLYDVVFTLQRIVKTRPEGVYAVYAVDRTSIGRQSSTEPENEVLLYANAIPVLSTLFEPIPGTGSLSGTFAQNGKANGQFFKWITP